MTQADGQVVLAPINFIVPNADKYSTSNTSPYNVSGALCISGAKLYVWISGWRQITTA